ncbi:hypothetical protein MMC30_004084 [Trapelia coarctata]|nr:hypothetical protein [Trapelia coarctata]
MAMANELPQICAVQALGLASAALVAGAAFSTSYIAIPSFQLASGSVSVRQWKVTYDRGKAAAPPMAALTASSFSYLAYSFSKSTLPTDTFRSQLYASAAVAIFCIIPYTLLVMERSNAVNSKLIAKLEDSRGSDVTEKVTEASLPKGETINELLDSWASHNAVRGLFSLTAVALGLWATLA